MIFVHIGGGAPELPWMEWSAAGGGHLSNLNRTVRQDVSVAGYRSNLATHPMPDGGYVEIRLDNSGPSSFQMIGLARADASLTNYICVDDKGWSYYQATGIKCHEASNDAYGATWTSGDVIGIGYKGGKIWFSKNNVWQGGGDPAAGTGEAFSGVTGVVYPACSRYSPNSQFTLRPSAATQAYAPPAGFFAPSS